MSKKKSRTSTQLFALLSQLHDICLQLDSEVARLTGSSSNAQLWCVEWTSWAMAQLSMNLKRAFEKVTKVALDNWNNDPHNGGEGGAYEQGVPTPPW